MILFAAPVFLLVLAASISGWGGLALPDVRCWPDRFGSGTLLTFFIVAAAGWSGLLYHWVLWIILAGGLLLWARPGRFIGPRGALLLSLAGLILVPLVALPPASRDAVIHHLCLARIWLSAGEITRPAWSQFFSYPYLTESLYSLCGGTFGFRVARAVSLLGFLAACSVPLSYFLRRGRRMEAVVSLLVLFSIPELFRNATWSYSDTFLVFFSLLAYREFVSEKGDPVMAAVWAAGAACCKYNGLVVLASVLFLIPFMFRDMSLKRYLTAAFLVIFISSWWALPNLLQWGNPVYPLLRGVFGPAGHVSQRAGDYFALAPFSSSLNTFTDYLLFPLRMSIHGEWNDPFLFDGASGPLLLAGTIVSIPVLKGRRRQFMLPALVLLLTLVMKNSAIRTRYLLPGLAMLSIPVAQGLSLLFRRKDTVIRYAVMALVAGCLVWSGGKLASLYRDERPWEFPTDEEYLCRRLPDYSFMQECRRFVADSDTTLMVNMLRAFYYPGHAIYSDSRAPLDLVEMFWDGAAAADVADSLRGDGVGFIAADMMITSINVPTVLDSSELSQWRRFVSGELVPELTMGNYVLFRLR